jgi:hypothetical protein
MPIVPVFTKPPVLNPRFQRIGRRRFIQSVALGGAVAATFPYRAFAVPLKPRPAEYLVFIDGKRSGTYTTEFVPRKNGFTATTSMSIRVDVLFVTAYRYQQDGQEDWDEGKLMGFDYVTNDDGKPFLVGAKRAGDSFTITGRNGQKSVPGDAMSSGFWNSGLLKCRHLVDPQTAELVPLSVKPLAHKSATIAQRTIQGEGHSVDTFLKGTIWFDEHQHLLATSFIQDGHKVEMRHA